MPIDFRAAINAISDVVQNRPAPLREFDQIYMKTGDMIDMAYFVAERFEDREVVFVGDGDAIALSIMHLLSERLLTKGPRSILVLDFDERIVNSIVRFADRYRLDDRISARLYNVVDPLPDDLVGARDAFYTNPPWGASNEGQSVLAFLERGMEAMREGGVGAVVIADSPALSWTQEVIFTTQQRALAGGFVVGEMVPSWHLYHLDDAPDLTSCVMLFRRVRHDRAPARSLPLSPERYRNFYGRETPLRVRYVRERPTLNYGRAPESTYELVPMEV